MPLWMVFALLALSFWGLTGLTQKLSTNEVSAEFSYTCFAAAFMPIGLVVVLTQSLDWRIPAAGWALAILGGVLNGLGSLTSFAAYRSGGKASIVTPLVALYPVVTVAAAVAFLGERVGLREIAGILLALSAAVALSFETETSPSGQSEIPPVAAAPFDDRP
jgi:transporter family protein